METKRTICAVNAWLDNYLKKSTADEPIVRDYYDGEFLLDIVNGGLGECKTDVVEVLARVLCNHESWNSKLSGIDEELIDWGTETAETGAYSDKIYESGKYKQLARAFVDYLAGEGLINVVESPDDYKPYYDGMLRRAS